MSPRSISIKNRGFGLLLASALAVLWVVQAPTACHASKYVFGGNNIPNRTRRERLRPSKASGISYMITLTDAPSSRCDYLVEISYQNLKSGGKELVGSIYKGNKCSAKLTADTNASGQLAPTWKNTTKDIQPPWAKGLFSQESTTTTTIAAPCSDVIGADMFSNPTAYRAVLLIKGANKTVGCARFKKY
eukprot:TRINITY_DN30931_c0_g1_i1.p1 TRINITY_DN30931_c0_g1~~TRINITY_DN30931_c0_g1_i1.p1  ORF type:complete len:189 (-),score=9.71 TRINITY_DN30931_c0_g1_i1:135-701(-)